jgi:glycosyltransferase involved in cell wall biosynthesis
MKILHVDTADTWRGGQAQIYNLLKYMPDAVDSHLLTPPDSELSTRLKSDNIPAGIHFHPLRGEWDLAAAFKIQSLNKEFDFDLIHAHSSRALGIAWLASALFSLPPHIETRRLETTVAHNLLGKKKYASAKAHIANSETVKEGLLESGIPGETIIVIPSGIDLQRIQNTPPDWQLIQSLGLDPARPIIGNVGALSPQKDQRTFIRSAALVHEAHPQAQFVIAGEGELREYLTELITELELEETVVLAGFQQNIFGLMKTFDIFVLTSLYEGLCGTILQAMACEIPVVSSPVKGSRQILFDGDTCLIAAMEDPGDFAEKIAHLLDSPDLQERLTDGGREIAPQYDYAGLSQRTYELYREVVSI